MVALKHTDAILDFAAAPHALPPEVRADAGRLLADTLAVGAAGAVSPAAARVLETVSQWGQGGEARLLSGGAAASGNAAFFNGFAIHCLEWDAVHEPAVVHALSVVTAALLAASDRMGGSDPEELLVALAVGVDIASGLGIAATGPLRFFRPATAGIIGAALAVARLEGMTQAQLSDVLGLAYSFAGGTMQAHVEASIALPLQIAHAAHGAVTAVDLVRAGLDGPHDALEGPFGYATLIEPLDFARYTPDLGRVWRIAEVSTKPFPSGRASHGVLGALQGRRAADHIEAHVPPLVHRLVGRLMQPDMTAAYARLCLPFLVALMLTDGVIDPRRFTPETTHDVNLTKIASRVRVIVDGNPDPNALSPQRLIFDGDEILIPDTLGSPAAPLSPGQAQAKIDLAKDLSGQIIDERLFTAPLNFFAGVR